MCHSGQRAREGPCSIHGHAWQAAQAVENLSVAVGAAEVVEQGVSKGIIKGVEGKAELAHDAESEVS